MKTASEHIKEMLKENTGTHFLDSGGDGGRNWQQNQQADFDKQPRITWDIWGNEINETVNIYHFLSDILEVNQITEAVNEFIKANKIHWTGEFIEALEGLDTFADEPFIGVCGTRVFIHKVSESFNTYNYENNTSQIMQFCTFTCEVSPDNYEPYVILQIHGGCDARGGYTQARCFKLKGMITGQVDVYGTIDGVEVSNAYNGYSLTDENGNDIEINEGSKVSLDFYPMMETYLYTE